LWLILIPTGLAIKTAAVSTSGFIIQIFGNTVSFGSKAQKTVALSSTEAELMAVTEGVKEILYIKNLLSEFIEVQLPIPVQAHRASTFLHS